MKAYHLLKLYDYIQGDKSKILIKIATTVEGIEACRILQNDNINCNMTLLFTWEQAQLCHKANAFLISPFVNRQSKYKLNEDPNYKFN